MSGSMIKNFRILILLYVLLMVALSTWWTKERSTDWDAPLVVAIYPINGDGRERPQNILNDLIRTLSQALKNFLIVKQNAINSL